MENKIGSKKYQLANTYHIATIILVVASLLLFILGIIASVTTITALSSANGVVSTAIRIFNAVLYFIGLSILSPFVLISFAYLFPDLTTDEQGLSFKFLFKTYRIPWNEVLYTKAAKLFGFKMPQNATVVVTKNPLTLLHRFYGWVYGNVNNPALLIHSKISDYSLLKKSIDENVKMQHRIPKK